MMLLCVGCNFRTAPLEIRERLAFREAQIQQALEEIGGRYGLESVILSTCNRVEIYLARADTMTEFDPGLIAEFLSAFHHLHKDLLAPHLYYFHDVDVIKHLFRVSSSLDSMLIGEGQILGQVKAAYEAAIQAMAAGPILHAVFQHAQRVAGRVHSETGIARGHVSVASAAIDYVRQVFEHFDDKIVLVIGAGKMGRLTLSHLARLRPREIWVTNRDAAKAREVASHCEGKPVPWDQLDEALCRADIVLSTTGSPAPIVSRRRFDAISARRTGGAVVILDIAVPRDFDPRIHDGDRTCLFNIDDLQRLRDHTLQERQRHVSPAEAIVDHEVRRFLSRWARRKNSGLIARLTEDFESKRQTIVRQLLNRLNGQLTDADRTYIEGAFRLLQNQFLHGPITALTEEVVEDKRHTLREALRKLFWLQD